MKKLLLLSIFAFALYSQDLGFDVFDNGKMWTFDNPPIEYFEKTYGFKPTKGWLDSVRMSALRFSNYCSASFVSNDGLVMTNHHCARQSVTAVQKQGEDFNNNSFYAKSNSDERKVPGLFVDQLIKLEDVTSKIEVLITESGKKPSQDLIDSLSTVIKKEFVEKPDWKDLEIQIVSFFKGATYSVYGFKRHNDVRLVFSPELQLGFFGGDPDNFTYPRYALDCAFFRIYENDKPLKSPIYFKFNLNGVKEYEPVFVIGNPGRTERLNTLSQLNFAEKHQLPLTLDFIQNRIEVLSQFNRTAKNDSVMNRIFSLENSKKALSGMLGGLKDVKIQNRKQAIEKHLKEKSELNSQKVWQKMDSVKKESLQYFYTYFLTAPRDLAPNGLEIAKEMAEFSSLSPLGKDSIRFKTLKKKFGNFKPSPHLNLEKSLFEVFFKEIRNYQSQIQDAQKLLGYENKIEKLLNSKIYENNYVIEWSKKDSLILESNDLLIEFGHLAYSIFKKSKSNIEELSFVENQLSAEIAKIQFKVFEGKTPPDANFNLRIADGLVKGYPYNGTVAPFMTTYYGLYDRYYSNLGSNEWALPLKWLNPNKELLKTPINFVSTNDIIGGNSGSAIINRKREAVGLVFDGNIESLPGRYIFLDDLNRTVSVHSGGIYAALKHIYKAQRICKELDK
ncbi:MAG: S46 family peptidase [Cytophagales bacterium]